MNNKLFERNKNSIRKRVFVKEKVIVPKKLTASNRFTCNIEQRQNKPSLLSDFIGNSKKFDYGFMLHPPADKDPNSIKTKIYFFSTPKFLEIHVSRKNIVSDVIRHILTMYQRNDSLSKGTPLKYPNSYEQYELRLIDDDDYDSDDSKGENNNYYKPSYEYGALEYNDDFGEFESLAFVQVKDKPQSNQRI